MQLQAVPGFPYSILVRVPLIIYAPLVALITYGRLCRELVIPIPPLRWDLAILVLVLSALLLAVIQLVAVPQGLRALSKAGAMNSSVHNLAVACGVLQLGLLVVLLEKACYVE
jgi:hypothetical protein